MGRILRGTITCIGGAKASIAAVPATPRVGVWVVWVSHVGLAVFLGYRDTESGECHRQLPLEGVVTSPSPSQVRCYAALDHCHLVAAWQHTLCSLSERRTTVLC